MANSTAAVTLDSGSVSLTSKTNTIDSSLKAHNATSNLSVLSLRSMRLLDLHRLSDWPNITPETFKATTRDGHLKQKARLQGAEWVLYRLFEMWDPKETRITLRPFFPALEPLQSTKLRAALFQWLSKLKTSHALDRDFPLRKTMLDDCKGERFEEMLFLFTLAVLKKATAEKGGPGLIVRRITTADHISETDETELLDPLLLAYTKSLASSKHERAILKTRLQSRSSALNDKQKVMDKEVEDSQNMLSQYQELFEPQSLSIDATKKLLRREIASDNHVLSVFISGETDVDRDHYPEQVFEQWWQNHEVAHSYVPGSEPFNNSLLTALQDRVYQQRTRLENWREFQNELSKRNEGLIVRSPSKTPAKTPRHNRNSPSKSPRKNLLKASSSHHRNLSLTTPPQNNAKHLTDSPTDAAVQRASRKLSNLTMDLGRLDLGHQIPRAKCGDIEPDRKSSMQSSSRPHSGMQNTMSLKSITQPSFDGASYQRSPSKVSERSSKFSQLTHQRARPDLTRLEVPDESEQKFNDQNSLKYLADDSKEISKDCKISILGDMQSKPSIIPSSQVTSKQRFVPEYTNKLNSTSESKSLERPAIARNSTEDPAHMKSEGLTDRTRRSLAIFNTSSSQHSSSNQFRKGHRKSKSAYSSQSKTRFPVNPFENCAEADCLQDISMSLSTFNNETFADVGVEMVSEPQIPVLEPCSSHSWRARGEERIENTLLMNDLTPTNRLPKEEEEDVATSIFMTRNKLRRSPPPNINTPSSGTAHG